MRLPVAVLVLLAALPLPLRSQSIRGVWKPVELVVTGGPDAGRHTSDVQPGLAIFTNHHFSTLLVEGFAPRPTLSANPTDQERVNVWSPFVGVAGTYTFTDSTVSYTPTVAKNPAGMSGTTRTTHVRLLADSLWFTVREANGVERRTKWVNVERLP